MRTRTTQVRALVLAAGLSVGGACGAAAQEQLPGDRPNAVYAELGGSGLATINFERALSRNASVRVGGGVAPLVGVDLLLMPSLAFGGRRHRCSAGLGLLAIWDEAGNTQTSLSGEIAYRFQATSGLVFRASVASLKVTDRPSVVPGVGLGWSF